MAILPRRQRASPHPLLGAAPVAVAMVLVSALVAACAGGGDSQPFELDGSPETTAADPDDSTLDDSTLDDSTLDDSTLDDSTLDDSTLDDSTLDDSTLDDSTLDDSSPSDPPTTNQPSTISAVAADGEIAILADSARPLDRRLFGTNVPAWLGPERLADPAFQAATEALGTTLLRFPGGSWSNGYDWLACEFGEEPGCFATWAARPSDFVGFMRATGLPGVWTTSFNGTAEEAAAAVAFFNGDVDDDRALGVDHEGRDWKTVGEWARLRVAGGHPEPAEIDLWEVGNEVYAAQPSAGSNCAEFGWEDVWTCDGTQYVQGDDAHDGYLEFREKMRSVDPEIEVGAVGLFDGESWDSWGSEVIAGTGELLDFYVIHHYGFGGEPDKGSALALPQSSWPELMQVATETLAVGNPSRAVPVAITEYNMVAFQDADNDRLMASAINLLYIADTIGQMAENGVAIANQWNLANGRPPNGTDYGMIDADSGARNPQYYALALWTRFGDELLAADVGFETDTELSAYAGRADDGTISVLAINKTGEPTNARLRVDGGAASYTGRADVVGADSLEATTVEFNGSEDPSVDLSEPPAADLGEVGPEFDHTFEPYSVTLLRLTPDD